MTHREGIRRTTREHIRRFLIAGASLFVLGLAQTVAMHGPEALEPDRPLADASVRDDETDTLAAPAAPLSSFILLLTGLSGLTVAGHRRRAPSPFASAPVASAPVDRRKKRLRHD